MNDVADLASLDSSSQFSDSLSNASELTSTEVRQREPSEGLVDVSGLQ